MRVEHKPRIAAIESELREQRFELAIQQAEAALAAGDLAKARDQVAAARLEYADRNVSSLLARIEAAEAQRRMQSLLAKDEQHVPRTTGRTHYVITLEFST